MEQARDFSSIGINARQVWTFFQVALPTGKGKIVKMRRPSVLFSNDVFHVKRPTEKSLRH